MQVRYPDGSVAELAVEISAPTQRNTIAGCTTVTLRDRFVLRNRTGLDLEWMQPAADSEGGVPKLFPLADGKDVPLCWGPGAAAHRLQVRPQGGTHSWCAAFSPEVLGQVVLKLRPNTDDSGLPARTQISAYEAARANGVPVEDAIPQDVDIVYLRLIISMEGSQRMMQLLPASISLKQLPYRVCNESDLLIAFRQHGSSHWDLLGGGEACEYIWDDPRATHALQLHAADATGTAIANSVPAAYHLDRVDLACADLKLDPRHADPSCNFVSPNDTMLLSVACTLRYGVATSSRLDGWLCLTNAQLLFIPFTPGASASVTHMQLLGGLMQLGGASNARLVAPRRGSVGATMRRGSLGVEGRRSSARMSAAGGAAGGAAGISPSELHELHEIPLTLEQIAEVVNGTREGELLLRTTTGAVCILRGLRNRDNTRERIDAAQRSIRSARYRDQRQMQTIKDQINSASKRMSQRRDSSSSPGKLSPRGPNSPRGDGKPRVSIVDVIEPQERKEVGASLIAGLARAKMARKQFEKKRQMRDKEEEQFDVSSRPHVACCREYRPLQRSPSEAPRAQSWLPGIKRVLPPNSLTASICPLIAISASSLNGCPFGGSPFG